MKNKIFLINLDRASDRLALVEKQFRDLGLDFERLPAVDAKSTSEEILNKHYSKSLNRKHYFTSLTKTEIACYMSHLKAMNKVIEEDLDYAIILEDDIVLYPNFKYVHNIIASIKEDWEYLKLQINQGRKKKITKRNPIEVASLPDVNFEHISWSKIPIGASAYVISKKAAKKFLKTYPLVYRPADVDLQFPWEHKINITGISPELVGLNSTLESSVQSKKQKKHYPLARIIYKIKFFINSKLKY